MNRSSWRRAAASASLCAIVVWTGCSAQHGATAPQSVAPSVSLAIARDGSIEERVEAQGHVGPPAGSAAKLAFAQAGILRSIDVRVGERVRAGQPLATLDRLALAAPLAQARADALAADASYAGGAIPAASERGAAAKVTLALEKLQTLQRGGPSAQSGRIAAATTAQRAELKVAGDEAALARERELFAAGVVARKDVEAANLQLANDRAERAAAEANVSLAATDSASALAQAQAELAAARSDERVARAQDGVLAGAAASARARLDAARVAYQSGILTAPADGIVLSLLRHPGESVDPATPVLEVGPAIGRGVTLSVPASTARRIVAGASVVLSVGGVAGERALGRVASVVPVVDPATQLATIVVTGAPADAIAGDAVSARISVGRVSGIIVPATAIVEDPQTGRTVVFVRTERHNSGEPPFEMRTVNVRASDDTSAAIAAGVRSGERIAARGGYMLLAPEGS